WILGAVLAIAHFGEQAFAEAGALDRLEVLLRDDHVGVDVVDRHRRRDAGQCRKLVHRIQTFWLSALSPGQLERALRASPWFLVGSSKLRFVGQWRPDS